nr:uncharacterized mitochondrial protein AtMg00810-like [Tanacetum cinerariifolium]
MEHSNLTLAKIPIMDTGKFKQWKFRIQQYLQNEHYALWEVIEFRDSYEAPQDDAATRTTCTASEGSAKKKGRTVAAAILKTFGGNEASKKTKKNQLKQQYGNFKAEGSETLEQTFNRLQAIVSHLEFMDVEIEQDDLNYKFLTSLALEWLMYTIVWRNRGDLDTMSLDDVYNHLKVYEPEVQKKSESNSQNMVFISSAKNSSGNGEVNTASIPTARTQVSPASANVAVASISLDTTCAYIASQSNGSQVKYEEINQIDEDDIEEMDIKWNMALLSMRADRFWKKTGKKISIQGTDVAGFDKSKVECFNCHKMSHFARECREPRSQERGRRENFKQGSKVEESAPKALMAIDGVRWDWSYMANEEENHALVADEEAPIEFALMAKSSSDSEVEARLVEFKNQEIKFCEKIRGLEFKVESKTNRIKSLTNELEMLKKEKDGLDSKLTADSPTVIKTNKDETVRKPSVKYSKIYIKTSKSSNVRGNQRNWDNLKSQQLGKKNLMKNKACFNCGDFDHLSYDCGKWVENRKSRPKNNTHKSIPPITIFHKYDRSPTRTTRPNMNVAQPKRTSFYKPAHSYVKRPFQRTSTVRTQFKVLRVSTVNRKFPTVNRKFLTGNSKLSTADLGNKGKAVKASACWIWKPKQNSIDKGSNSNSVSVMFKKYKYIDTHGRLNGCSWHMTGNISYLSYYEPYDEGLVRYNLVKGLPSKCFDNNHTYVACLKGKQHKASCKTKSLAIGFLKPFGCHVMILNTLDHLGKFEAKGDEGTKDAPSQDVKKDMSSLRYIALPNWFHEAYLESSTSNAQDACKADALESSGNSNPTATSINPPADQMETLIVETPIPTVSSPVPTACLDESSQLSSDTSLISKRVTSQDDTPSLDNILTLLNRFEDILRVQQIQEEGIDYEEVFAPVVRIEAIRLFLAYASFMGFTVYQMDVKSVFLYGTIDEKVYVMQPPGFQDPEFPARVYKKKDDIFLSQDKYVGDILKNFGYSDVRSSNTPMDKENPCGKYGTGKDVDLHLYRSMIGSLMYLTASRPDIMFAICACARNQVTPKECHLHVVKRIFRYLKGHPKLGLLYPKESPFDLVAYSDGDYGGATQDRKSTTGGCQFLGRRLISRQCKKQTIVATSTIEAEYVAATSGCGQVLLAFCDYHTMIAILEKYEHNIDFHPIVDFVEASYIRIETTDEGTKILATVDDAELFENLTLMGYNISPNQNFTFQKATNIVYNFSKMIFDGMVRNVNNKVSKFLMYPRVNSLSFSGRTVLLFDTMLVHQGNGSGTPTEPHHTPSPEAPQSPQHDLSSSIHPPVTTASIPTDIPPLRQYAKRARIAQSSALPTDVDEPASPLGDDSQGEACLTISGLEAEQDRANIIKTFTLPHDSPPRVTFLAADEGKMASKITAQDLEITSLKARIKLLEDKDGGVAEPSKEDATIKGRNLEIGEEAGVDKSTERGNNDTEELVNLLTSLDAANILTSGGVQVVSVPPAAEVSTLDPTQDKKKKKMVESDTLKKKKLQEQIDVQMEREMEEQLAREDQRMSEQIARDAEIARIHAEKELQMLIDSLDRNNEMIAKYLQDHSGWKVKHFKGMSLEQIKEKFIPVWKQIEDFVPMDSKKEGDRVKRKGLRLEQESAKKVKTSEEVSEEYLKTMMQLVPIEELWTLVKETLSIRQATSDKKKELWVELKRLYEPDVEDQLWTQTQALMHDPVEWRLYDTCGVHHVLSRDQEIFMLVERDYPLRKGLAIVMISNKLQVENYSQMANDLIQKIYKIANSLRQRDD